MFMSDKKFPKIVVGILIFNQNGEIFLGKWEKWKNTWTVPGGHVEWGEKLEEAVKREAKEETGLDITNIQFFNILEMIFPKELHEPRHMISMEHTAETVSTEVTLNDEMQEYVWIKPEKAISELNLGTSTRTFIQRFIDKNNYVR